MFKVSFNEDDKKIEVLNNKVTTVTLIGLLRIPTSLWIIFPNGVTHWMWEHQGVDVSLWFKNRNYCILHLKISGRSSCADGDTFDSVIGERIAEARAKIRLYKFVHNWSERLMKEYYGILYGNAEFDVIRESHTEAPKDCLYLTCQKYRELWIKESHHLGELLKEA